MSGRPEFHAFLADLSARLPAAYRFDPHQLDLTNPVAREVSAALAGKPASLPYCGAARVNWVTLAPSAERLREIIADLRCWVLPSFGWTAVPEVTLPDGSGGAFAATLIGQSPAGYLRWQSDVSNFGSLIERLALMRDVSEKAPARRVRLRPTLDMLRREFTFGLALGDAARGRAAVAEIDRRQLDSAANSFAMQVRLAAAFGDDTAIVSDTRLADAVQLRLPASIIEAILAAHHRVLIAPHEQAGDWDKAFEAYTEFAPLLASIALASARSPAITRILAYRAVHERDWRGLAALSEAAPDDAVIRALFDRAPSETRVHEAAEAEALYAAEPPPVPLENAPPVVQPSVEEDATRPAPSAAVASSIRVEGDEVVPDSGIVPKSDDAIILSWAGAAAIIADARGDALEAFIRQLHAAPDSLAIGDGEALLDLFIDDAVTADHRRQQMAERVLTEVIDAYVCEPRFPRRDRLAFYQAVADIWVDLRERSTDPTDGQMLLLLVDALLTIDGKMEAMVAQRIERWWEARPVRARLAWLGEALELLTEQSSSKAYLPLWFAAAKLLRQDGSAISASDFRLWLRLGRRLELDQTAITETLGDVPSEAAEAIDPIASAGFAKIAIVSLHERAARTAAEEIAQRCTANVIVVTDHAAGEATDSASSADVILFVWGATKHAVYRAFDKVRDRLEYVQGTGSASIVRALERRASQATAA